MLGPVIGGLLYHYVGYFGAFIIFAAILALAWALSYFGLSSTLNIKLDILNKEERALSVSLE